MEETRKKDSGILMAGIYLLLISIAFIMGQVALAFKLDWSFSNYRSTLNIIRWFVYIIAGGVFFIGSIELLKRKRRGWRIGILYSSLLIVITIVEVYGTSKVLHYMGMRNELFPAFVAFLLGWINGLLVMNDGLKSKAGVTKQNMPLFMAIHVFSGLIVIIFLLTGGSSQMEEIIRNGQIGGKEVIRILFAILKGMIATGSLGIVVLGSIGIAKRRPWLFPFGIIASAVILLGAIGVLFLGLHILERNMGVLVDWIRFLISVMGFIASSFFLIYIFKRKNLFS